MFDVHFWEAVGFFAIIALLYRPARNFIVKGLDEYSSMISANFSSADSIKKEAEELVALYSERHSKFMNMAELIEEATNENLGTIKRKSELHLDNLMKLKKIMHQERLQIYEAEEHAKLMHKTVYKALHITKSYLEDKRIETVSGKEINSILHSVSLAVFAPMLPKNSKKQYFE